jgi:hypothetical protein
LVHAAAAVMRYQEQLMHRLEVPLDPAGGGGLAERLAAQFTQEYARRYGASAASAFQAAEIFALRARTRPTCGHRPDGERCGVPGYRYLPDPR